MEERVEKPQPASRAKCGETLLWLMKIRNDPCRLRGVLRHCGDEQSSVGLIEAVEEEVRDD